MMKSRPSTALLVSMFLACAATSQEELSVKPSVPVGKLIAARYMTTARGSHTATILPDFNVLIFGGKQEQGVVLATTEVYDPTTETFSPGAKMADRKSVV